MAAGLALFVMTLLVNMVAVGRRRPVPFGSGDRDMTVTTTAAPVAAGTPGARRARARPRRRRRAAGIDRDRSSRTMLAVRAVVVRARLDRLLPAHAASGAFGFVRLLVRRVPR